MKKAIIAVTVILIVAVVYAMQQLKKKQLDESSPAKMPSTERDEFGMPRVMQPMLVSGEANATANLLERINAGEQTNNEPSIEKTYVYDLFGGKKRQQV